MTDLFLIIKLKNRGTQYSVNLLNSNKNESKGKERSKLFLLPFLRNKSAY